MKILALTLFFAATVLAAEPKIGEFATPQTITFTNKSGMAIKDAPVTKVTKERVFYRLPNGGGSVLIVTLPVDLQLSFGYDEVAEIKKQKEAEVKALEREVLWLSIAREKQLEETQVVVNGKVLKTYEAVKFHAEIRHIVEDGFVATLYDSIGEKRRLIEGRYGRVFILCDDSPLDKYRVRDLIEGYMLPAGTARMIAPNKVVQPSMHDEFDLAKPFKSETLPELRRQWQEFGRKKSP